MKRLPRWSGGLAGSALGTCALLSPWLVETPDLAGLNAYLVGSVTLAASAWSLAFAGSRGAATVRATLGLWLLASPFALGFLSTAAAPSAWVVGALLVATADPWKIALDAAISIRVMRLGFAARKLSPRRVAHGRPRRKPASPERLGRQIVERSARIRKTLLLEGVSRTELEMCVLGYGACADDMVTFARMVAEEYPKAGPVRRLRLRVVASWANRSLARAREAMPEGRVARGVQKPGR